MSPLDPPSWSSLADKVLGLMGAIISVVATIVGALSYIESRQRRLWWRYDSEGEKIRGLAGDHYLFYGRMSERGENSFLVRAIVRIEHHPTILMIWTKFIYFRKFNWVQSRSRKARRQRTSLRLIAPLVHSDISDFTDKKNIPDPFELFLMMNLFEYKDHIYDIRGDIYFDGDYFFTDCEGVNNFEKLSHTGYKSRTGQYRIFLLMGLFLDWQGRPTASECICIKRSYFDAASIEQKNKFILALDLLRREGTSRQFANIMNPIILPSEEFASNEMLPKLRIILEKN